MSYLYSFVLFLNNSGTFSVVRLGTNKRTGEKGAVKIIDKKTLGGDKKNTVNSEVEILKRVEHPNIVLLKEMFETQTCIYLVMELYVISLIFISFSPLFLDFPLFFFFSFTHSSP